jgi:hypothetical protein
VLHLASDFAGYAGQLTAPRRHGYVAFDVVLDGDPDAVELAEVLRATGGLLAAAAMVACSTPGDYPQYARLALAPTLSAATGTVGRVRGRRARQGYAPGSQVEALPMLSLSPSVQLFPNLPRALRTPFLRRARTSS